MGRRRKNDRDVSGLLLVDKPAGMTSHDVVARIRRAAGTRRVGHTGTLDPDATGLLPITLGPCTKLSNFLTLDEKVYAFELELGARTTTDDASGEVVERGDASGVTREALEGALGPYRGLIMQRPPRFSAIRVNGRRAHEMAREGLEFEIDAREVEVLELTLQGFAHPRATLLMRCSSGTYVRGVVRDVGRDLGCQAHTTMIRRLQVGAFTIEQATRLDALTTHEEVDAALHTPAQMMASLKGVLCGVPEIMAWSMGQTIACTMCDEQGSLELEQMVSVLDARGQLLGVAEVIVMEPGRLIVAPKKVLNAI